MRKKKDLIEVVMSMMMALGGVSIRLIAQSQDIRRAFTLDGYSIPDSANTIREMVLRFASYVQKGVWECGEGGIIQIWFFGIRHCCHYHRWGKGNETIHNIHLPALHGPPSPPGRDESLLLLTRR